MEYISTNKNIKLQRLESKTAVLYIRVSSQDQVNNFSIPTQIKEAREYLSKHNIKEVGIFIEKGESAKTAYRTEFQNLISFLKNNKNKVDYLLCYKLDRFSRNTEDFYYYKSLIGKYGTKIKSVTENIEESSTGRFIELIYAGIAQLDNENKGERVKHCMTTKALDGWYPTIAPYGYKNDKETKRLIRDERYFKHIQYCLKEFANGKSIPDLILELIHREVKTQGRQNSTPKYFTAKSLWHILDKSMFYAGVYDWKDNKNIQGKHEKMITWTEHLRIQERLHNKPTRIIRDEKDIFVLNFTLEKTRGFLHCSDCGERIRSCKSTGRGGEYMYYYCKNPNCTAPKKSKDKEELELLFQNHLKQVQPKDTYVDLFKELMIEEWHYATEGYKNISRDIESQIKQLELDKKETIAMRRRQELTEDEFKTEIDSIRAKINNLSAPINTELPPLAKFNKLLDNAEYFFKNVEPLYNTYPVSRKREMAQIFYPQGVLYGNEVLRTPTKSYLLDIFDVLESGNVNQMTLRRIELRLTD